MMSRSLVIFLGIVGGLLLIPMHFIEIEGKSETFELFIALSMDALFICTLFFLWDPKQFLWAGKTLAITIFCLYILYFIDEITSDPTLDIPDNDAETHWINALMGIFVLAIPFVKFVFKKKKAKEAEE